ncbi:MAG: MFS transporter [Pseudomonadota bacterium]
MTATADNVLQRRRGLVAVIATMVIVNLVYGLTLPLLSLVLDAQGVSKTMNGLSIVAQASAGVILAPFVPRLIIRVGATRVMQVAAVVAAAMLILLGLTRNVYIWFPIRFLLGASAAILWSASEAVINELAVENWRGRILAIYGAAGSAGFAMGPLILVATGTSDMTPFVVTAGFILFAGLPLFWVVNSIDADTTDEHPKLWRLFKLVPYIMVLNLIYAATIESILAFFPLYGIHIGIGEARSLSLLTVLALGSFVMHVPLGWLADHMDRFLMLVACILVTMIGVLFMPMFVAQPIGGTVYMLLFGGAEGMLYTLGIILLGQQFRGAELAAASVLYTGMWGAGTMIGPFVVGAGLDLFGNDALPYLLFALYASYLPFLLFGRRAS